MLNQDGTYYGDFAGFQEEINVDYDADRTGLLDITDYQTENVNGKMQITYNLDDTLATFCQDEMSFMLGNVINRKIGDVLLEDIDYGDLKVLQENLIYLLNIIVITVLKLYIR